MKLVPFDNAVICIQVYPRSKAKILSPLSAMSGELGDDARVMKVIAVGPGKRVETPESATAAGGDPAKLQRYPMNVKAGMFVCINAAMKVQPEGPSGRPYWVTTDNNVVSEIVGLEFSEDQKEAMEAGLEKLDVNVEASSGDDRFILPGKNR